MSRYNLAWLIAVPMAVLTGAILSVAAPAKRADSEYKLVRTVVDVLAEVDQHYVRPLDAKQKEKLVEDMINGGLRELDPHSQYFNAEQLKVFEQLSEGSFGGVGINIGIDPKSRYLLVHYPMPGTPAYNAGIRPGDKILSVDGKATRGFQLADAVKILKGSPHSPRFDTE